MEDRTLAVALWVSLGLHLLFFLLIPGPGEARESESIAVTVEWLPPASPPPIETGEAEREPEAAAIAETSENPVSDSLSDTVTDTLSDTVTDTASDSLSDTASGTLTYTDPPELPSPESDPPVLEESRIEALLDLTAEKIRKQGAETRYRFVEVREKIQRALESVHPGARFVRQDQARFRCILSFRIDDAGYIYDLGLRLPPGSGLDPRAIERAIATLNPLAPPPGEAKLPLAFEWRIDFLE